jgi:hypothetical protein
MVIGSCEEEGEVVRPGFYPGQIKGHHSTIG